jgi:hypothetical protein
MAFVPVRGVPLEPPGDANSSPKPRRRTRVTPPPATVETPLAWRAIVHVHHRDAVQTEWHLVDCPAPDSVEAHCPVGRRLIQLQGQPDGHCLKGGRCPLCEAGVDTSTPVAA